MGTETIRSTDGTKIAFERVGDGPPVILVDGALCYRAAGPSGSVAEQLAGGYTVFTYDRRGRGESGDTQPFAVEREIEDLAALIEAAGGSAHICAFSSGGALSLDAAAGLSIEKLAVYEPPFIVDDSRRPMGAGYVAELDELIADGRRGDAVKLFMRQVGVPAILVALTRFMPAWGKLKSIAPTLRYDAAAMGETQDGKPLPADRWSGISCPTLILVGGKSPDWMQHGQRELEQLLPSAQLRTLEGQTHMVKAKVLAPALEDFFAL